MIRIFLVLSAAAFVAACDAPPPPPVAAPQAQPVVFTGTPRERFIAAVEASGCRISPASSAQIQASSGLDEAQIRALAPELAASGLVELVGTDTLRLTTENCR